MLRPLDPSQDIAIARLRDAVGNVSVFPVIVVGEPRAQDVVEVVGAGCRNDDGRPGILRLARATYEKVRAEDLLCEGDSGGPVLRSRLAPALLGIGQADFKGEPSAYAWMTSRVTDAIAEMARHPR
jgi:hypothetical protein